MWLPLSLWCQLVSHIVRFFLVRILHDAAHPPHDSAPRGGRQGRQTDFKPGKHKKGGATFSESISLCNRFGSDRSPTCVMNLHPQSPQRTVAHFLTLSQQEILSSRRSHYEIGRPTSNTVNVLQETLIRIITHSLAQFICLIKLCALFN